MLDSLDAPIATLPVDDSPLSDASRATSAAILSRFAQTTSNSLTPVDYARVVIRAREIAAFVKQREPYLAASGADVAIFGTHWGREYLDTVAAKLGTGDLGMISRLRLIHNFSGMPIVAYRRDRTFPFVDPVFNRYLKLRALLPKTYHFAAPPVAGEAGWRVGDSVCNQDVAIVQERLAFMYFAGVLDRLTRERMGVPPVVVEIGAGIGLFALAVARCCPSVRYVICDVPEVLAASCAYLSVTLPNLPHYAVLPDGVFRLASEHNTTTRVTWEGLGGGIVYVPNYMMHEYGHLLDADMVINAMSLHEMKPAQIAYYSQISASIVRSREGLFFDMNTRFGERNPPIDGDLETNFSYRRQLPFVDLALGGTIWTNSAETLAHCERSLAVSTSALDLDGAFRIEVPYQLPPFDYATTCQILNEDLGDYIGVDFRNWMDRRNYLFADHLHGYRLRFGYEG